MSTAERLASALEALHASLKAYHYGRMPEAVQRAYDNAATEIAAYRSTPADGGGQGVTWRPPGPVTPEHPLKCLIVLPALRQSDGDWWACQKFFGDSEPLGWLPDTPEIRAAIGTPASTGGEDRG